MTKEDFKKQVITFAVKALGESIDLLQELEIKEQDEEKSKRLVKNKAQLMAARMHLAVYFDQGDNSNEPSI